MPTDKVNKAMPTNTPNYVRRIGRAYRWVKVDRITWTDRQAIRVLANGEQFAIARGHLDNEGRWLEITDGPATFLMDAITADAHKLPHVSQDAARL